MRFRESEELFSQENICLRSELYTVPVTPKTVISATKYFANLS